MPKQPGRYRVQTPDGRVRTVKVIDQNGTLMAVQGWLLWSRAVPLRDVQGVWLDAA